MKRTWDSEELIERFTLLHQVLVAEAVGQKGMKTMRCDSLPSAEDREEAQKGYT